MKTIRRERCVTHDVFGCTDCKGVVQQRTEREKNRARRAALQLAHGGRDVDLTRSEADEILALYIRAGEERLRANDTELLDLAEALERKPNSLDMWIGQLVHLDTDGEHGLNPNTLVLIEAWADYRVGVAS